MTPRHLALARAEHRLVDRLAALDARVQDGDESAWPAYCEAAAALAAIVPAGAPENGGALISTREMANRLGISSKTLLRKRKRGEVEALQLAERGRGALRWRP